MPYKPNQREYRAFSGEFHTSAPTSDGQKAYTVEGYATTFDEPYELFRDADGTAYYECVRSTALAGAYMDDVIFQLNHEGAPAARLRNGSMSLEADAHGLKVTARLDGSREARDLYEAISNGLIDRMSWGFTVPADGWEWDEQTRTSYINKVSKVFDVSAVSLPANEGTEIHARSYLDGVIEAEKRESLLRDMELREREALAITL